MKKSSTPSTISLVHYGDYQNMPPSSETRSRNPANSNISINDNNYFDNQQISLFGDPLQYHPPHEEFLENLDRNIYRSFRANSNTSSFADEYQPQNISDTKKEDENSNEHSRTVHSISGNIRIQTFDPGVYQDFSPENTDRKTNTNKRNFPESDSSSDNRTTPRYTNLENYEQRLSSNASDNVEYVDSRHLNLNRSTENYPRIFSRFSEEYYDSFEQYKDTREMIVEPPRIFPSEPNSINKNFRNYSNESLLRNDWFKPDNKDFSKIPKMRPSSKNVISINRQQFQHESPVATLFNDSGGSSSDGEKPVDVRSSFIEPLPNIRVQPVQMSSEIPVSSSISKIPTFDVTLESSHYELTKPSLPDSLTKSLNISEPIPKGLPPSGMPYLSKREISPVIVTNAICTGADYRINAPRSHKKPSFSILKDKSTQATKIPSPKHQSIQKITTQNDRTALSARYEKDFNRRVSTARRTLPQRSVSSHQLKLPRIKGINSQTTSDETQRPSVQFNMSSGVRSFTKSSKNLNIVPRGILQQKHPGMPFSGMPSTATQNTHIRSFETLPKKLPPLPNHIVSRTPSRRINKSSSNSQEDIRSTSAAGYNRPFYAIQNPTSQERGLLKVIKSAGGSPSAIPVVKSPWITRSMVDLSEKRGNSMSPMRRKTSTTPLKKSVRKRGRSMSPTLFDRRSSSQTEPRSSISSDRRSSNLTSVTTSDFSYRRSSGSPSKNFASKRTSSSGAIENKMNRRKSIFNSEPSLLIPRSDSFIDRTGRMSKSQRKVAKPTSLSPIIGTPNKDDPLSPEEIESSERFISAGLKFNNHLSGSLTKIPIRSGSDVINQSETRIRSRANSQPSSRSNSRGPSLSNSRSGSPMKEFTAPSRPNSRAKSMSPSKNTSKTNSRGGSESPSKPQSRANSRPTSRQTSRTTSRTTSRAGSRASSTHKENSSLSNNLSRSNSRKSISPPKNRNSKSPPQNSSNKRRSQSRSKSRSQSPKNTRRKSISSPKSTARSSSRSIGSNKSPEKQSQSNNSKATSSTERSRSPSKSNKRNSPQRSSIRKNENKSAKTSINSKSSDISSKRGSSFKRKESDSTLKREPSNLKRGVSNVKRETSNITREKSNLKRESSNLKRETSNLKREPSNLKRETSNLKKDTSTLKRETSNIKKDTPKSIKKEPYGLKRETSSLKKESRGVKREPSTSNLKREPSRMSLKKGTPTSIRKDPTNKTLSSDIKEEPSTPKTETSSSKIKREPSNLIKRRTDSNLSKKLENMNSFKKEKTDTSTIDSTSTQESLKQDDSTMTDTDGKLIALTKANVVSMTTAAITAQPVHITTAVTNHSLLNKTNSSGQLLNQDAKTDETKTFKKYQKTVTEYDENSEKEMKSSDNGSKSSATRVPFEKSDSLKTIIENPSSIQGSKNAGSTNGNKNNNVSPAPPSQPIEASVSVVTKGKSSDSLIKSNKNSDTNDTTKKKNGNGHPNGIGKPKDDEMVSVRAISVLPDVECDSANLQNSSDIQQVNQDDSEGRQTAKTSQGGNSSDPIQSETVTEGKMDDLNEIKVIGEGNKNQSGAKTDGLTNADGSGNEGGPQGSQEFLTGSEDETTGCCGRSKCCRCCTRMCICMPCRRCKCSPSKCCTKKKNDTTSDIASDVAPVIVKEVNEKVEKTSCWKKMNCCKRKKPKQTHSASRMETIAEEPEMQTSHSNHADDMDEPKRGKCSICLRRFFCCRPANKIKTSTETQPKIETDETVRKCCFCIPCKRKVKKSATPAWKAPVTTTAERRESILSVPKEPQQTRCQRIMNKLKFWKKTESARKTSSKSRKQSLVPTNPPEDTRSRLHNDLVEYNSKMKAAIPVLPIYLAYFCTGCNIIIPGLGTILSGFFCLCFGIPRFSQYDSAKARFGSFIINCIVGIAQFFCVLFCFVGWGWSIWWGSIMMKTAKKLQKVRKVEKLELEEEQRQAANAAAAEAAAAQAAAVPKPLPITSSKSLDKDVEAGKP